MKNIVLIVINSSHPSIAEIEHLSERTPEPKYRQYGRTQSWQTGWQRSHWCDTGKTCWESTFLHLLDVQKGTRESSLLGYISLDTLYCKTTQGVCVREADGQRMLLASVPFRSQELRSFQVLEKVYSL